jgi:hypothetical protein
LRQPVRLVDESLWAALPEHAYSQLDDKLLQAILEGGAKEADESMQDRWANLLANAMTSRSAEVPRALPTMLGELEPAEASMLDSAVNRRAREPAGRLQLRGSTPTT